VDPDRPRNEALDCLILALAACRLSGVDLARAARRRTPGQDDGSRADTAASAPDAQPAHDLYAPIPFRES